MDCEEIMNIFDFYWFEHKIMSNSTFSPSILEAPKLEIKIESSFPKHSSIPSRHKRSFSDQLSSQTSLDSESSSSPRSVLTPYKLQTILSGKETMEKDEQPLPKMEKVAEKPLKLEKSKRRRNRGGVSSKSLSDLEFEELKGFMDLGFVFSEEDKNSSLVSIIPGLQRLGQENQEHQEPEEEEDEEQEPEEEEEEEEEKVEEKMVVSRRPYLSEAWEVMNQTRRPYQEIYHYQNYQKQQQPLMNWRFPAMSNEIDMKDHLRSWAHSVASTVR